MARNQTKTKKRRKEVRGFLEKIVVDAGVGVG